MVYMRLLESYCDTPEQRYVKLMQRCPNLKEKVPLKEIASFLVKDMNRYEETGSFISIDTISGTNAHMGFHGCEEKSFFKNGNFEAAYVGTGNWKECIGIWIEYRCIGRLESFNSNHKGNAKVQMASSCYFGKVLIDVENGNLLKGDMIELISGVIKTKMISWYPNKKEGLCIWK